LVEAASALKKRGAKDIYAAVTHPVLSGPAIKRIEDSVMKGIFVTDTIPLSTEKAHKKIKVLSIAPLLAEAIKRIHNEESVSSLFD
ncbi:MAG: ribose-phosphate pyrophosphokinase, partial [Candidatus Omnitrophica bacterium]|nr:ribose-phosphate pyrophosphokinase [Candidatus Omnitrophota bacterium]